MSEQTLDHCGACRGGCICYCVCRKRTVYMKVGGPVIKHAGSTKYGQWLYAFMCLCDLLHVSQWFLCINVTVCVCQ